MIFAEFESLLWQPLKIKWFSDQWSQTYVSFFILKNFLLATPF